MQAKRLVLNTSVVVLMNAAFSVHAAEGHSAAGVFYDPSNVASPTGKTLGYELFRTIGCPGRQLLDKPCPVPPESDSDGDGVVDSQDKCPDTPKGRSVNAQGCESDRDGDGVVDAEDKCPDVYAKTPDGCPEAPAAALTSGGQGAQTQGVGTESTPQANVAPAAAGGAAASASLKLDGPNFDFDRSTLRPDAREKLQRDAEALKESEGKIEVAGHTDSIGTERYNLGLSLRRAQAARAYLIEQGIAADRLIIKGYGESRPVASNATPEGRAQNRRVELVPLR